MIETVAEFERLLNELNPTQEEFILQTDDLVEQLSAAIAAEVYPAVFSFFESHSDCDCGAPGTLVHLVEHYYPNYVEMLLRSARNNPSYNSIWMVNRILNSDIPASQREEMLGILNSTAIDASVSPVVRDLASGFIEHQSLRGS